MSNLYVVHSSRPAGATATVWELYNEKAKHRDKALLKDWNSSINSLLLFAAIFAAVLTALCVESLKLLRQDPLDALPNMHRTLLYIALKGTDPSQLPPPPSTEFKPPDWAIAVNALFFIGLSTSILTAVGAVTCLQWVGEYDVGLEDASTPQQRALRWHYRYRSTEKWYMRQMIATLPILLYISVALFFIGLKVWFLHLYQPLHNIPAICLAIWIGGYIVTHLLAVFVPSVPYRTPITRLLFRFLWLAQYCLWKMIHSVLFLVPHLFHFLVHYYRMGQAAYHQYKNQYIVKQALYARKMEEKRSTAYPWMPPGRDHWQSMHSYIWERGKVEHDQTLPLSAIAWLANSMDLTHHSRADFELLIEALNQLSDKQVSVWPSYKMDAPWSHIFKLVLEPSPTSIDQATRRPKIIQTLASILQKMSLHPTLFTRMVPDMDHELLAAFVDRLAFQPPTSTHQAEKRLQSITALVSSRRWEGMPPHLQPTCQAFQAIHDCLSILNAQIDDGSTSWLFTLCKGDKPTSSTKDQVAWPDPEYITLTSDAFLLTSLRERATERYITFIDAQLSARKPTEGEELWRWHHSSTTLRSKYRAASIKILGEHLLRFASTITDPKPTHEWIKRVESSVSHPALKLVLKVCLTENILRRDSGGTNLLDIPIPEANNQLWEDQAWVYAILYWFGLRGKWITADVFTKPGNFELQFKSLVLPILSKSDRFDHEVEELIANYYNLLPASIWINIFERTGNIRRFALHMTPKQWIEVFATFTKDDFPTVKSKIFTALLQTLFSLFPTTRYQLLWLDGAQKVISLSSNSPTEETNTNRQNSATNAANGERPGFLETVVTALRRKSMSPGRDADPSPLQGLLATIRNTLDEESQKQPPDLPLLRACIVLADNLALHYVRHRRSDNAMRRAFRNINSVTGHILRRINIIGERHIQDQTLEMLVNQTKEIAYGWITNLTSTRENCTEAGGLARSNTHESITLDEMSPPIGITGVPRVSTPQSMASRLGYIESTQAVSQSPRSLPNPLRQSLEHASHPVINTGNTPT